MWFCLAIPFDSNLPAAKFSKMMKNDKNLKKYEKIWKMPEISEVMSGSFQRPSGMIFHIFSVFKAHFSDFWKSQKTWKWWRELRVFEHFFQNSAARAPIKPSAGHPFLFFVCKGFWKCQNTAFFFKKIKKNPVNWH